MNREEWRKLLREAKTMSCNAAADDIAVTMVMPLRDSGPYWIILLATCAYYIKFFVILDEGFLA
jgi:hypothetical protein